MQQTPTPKAEQEKYKMNAAQDMLQQAKNVTQIDPSRVGTKEVSEALSNAGQALADNASKLPDYKSQKVVEDMSKLVGAAEQLITEKDIADRMQRIAKEAELAQNEQKGLAKEAASKVSVNTKEVKNQAQSLVNNLGPLMKLILTSYEFRQMVVDLVKIAKTVFLRTTDESDVGSRVERQWLHGKDPAEIAKDVANKTADTVTDDKGKVTIPISDEELETLQSDLLELFSVIARDNRYRDGISRLFDLSNLMYEEAQPLVEEAKEAAEQPHTQKLKEETKDLVAQFTGKEKLEKFLESFKAMGKRLRDDQEWRQYLEDLKAFILETRDPNAPRTEEFKQKVQDLVNRGRNLMDRMSNEPEVENFLNSANELMDSLKDEQLVSALREKAGIVYEDLTYEDAFGNRMLDTQVVGNVRKFIVPVLADALKYIPIPRIESSNYEREICVDNVVLCGYDIIPENIFVHLEADSFISVKELEANSSTRLLISLRNFRTEIKDVQFYYKRKSFPQIEDEGRVTLRVGGRGANLRMAFRVEQGPDDSVPKFVGSHVNFHIDDMDFDFDRSSLNHDVLIPMVTNLWKRNIVHGIERAVEKNLGGVINDIGFRLTEAMSSADTTRNFRKQMNWMGDTVKRAEFAKTYQQRQEKLEHS